MIIQPDIIAKSLKYSEFKAQQLRLIIKIDKYKTHV